MNNQQLTIEKLLNEFTKRKFFFKQLFIYRNSIYNQKSLESQYHKNHSVFERIRKYKRDGDGKSVMNNCMVYTEGRYRYPGSKYISTSLKSKISHVSHSDTRSNSKKSASSLDGRNKFNIKHQTSSTKSKNNSQNNSIAKLSEKQKKMMRDIPKPQKSPPVVKVPKFERKYNNNGSVDNINIGSNTSNQIQSMRERYNEIKGNTKLKDFLTDLSCDVKTEKNQTTNYSFKQHSRNLTTRANNCKGNRTEVYETIFEKMMPRIVGPKELVYSFRNFNENRVGRIRTAEVNGPAKNRYPGYHQNFQKPTFPNRTQVSKPNALWTKQSTRVNTSQNTRCDLSSVDHQTSGGKNQANSIKSSSTLSPVKPNTCIRKQPPMIAKSCFKTPDSENRKPFAYGVRTSNPNKNNHRNTLVNCVIIESNDRKIIGNDNKTSKRSIESISKSNRQNSNRGNLKNINNNKIINDNVKLHK